MEPSTAPAQAKAQLTTKSLFLQDSVRMKFKEILGKKAPAFITSVLQIASQNDMLSKADPMSIYNAACVAATLDLPLNQNLGFSYIVPYNVKQKDGTFKTVAQFQLGYKGFKQLAIRTGMFETIHSSDVREGEIKHRNRLTGEIEFNWIEDEAQRMSAPIIGYVSYFKLRTGFEQTFFMTIEQLKDHGKKYSKTFSNKYGLWETDFDGMAHKTVVKLNLSKNAPLSIELQKATIADQGIILNEEGTEVRYADNDSDRFLDHEKVSQAKEDARIMEHIQNAKTLEELEQVECHLNSQEIIDSFDKKKADLTK